MHSKALSNFEKIHQRAKEPTSKQHSLKLRKALQGKANIMALYKSRAKATLSHSEKEMTRNCVTDKTKHGIQDLDLQRRQVPDQKQPQVGQVYRQKSRKQSKGSQQIGLGLWYFQLLPIFQIIGLLDVRYRPHQLSSFRFITLTTLGCCIPALTYHVMVTRYPNPASLFAN